VPPEQSTSQTVTPVIMDVNPTSQTKGKELEASNELPYPKGNLFNDTRAGGLMHDNSANFKEFVKQQFNNLAAQMSTLVNSLAFTVKR
ncbi:5780_t:CDS:2, partial [Funneliformis geosporum]